jgi:CheY-like chemotaxis protein
MTRVVLVVEDEALVRAFAADVLEEAGFEVIEAPSADYAVVVLGRRSDVVVLFTDIEMPGDLNGLDLARFVHDQYPAIRIVVVSGRARPAAGDLPPNVIFFAKPYSAETIIRAARNMRHDAHVVAK